MIFTRGLRTIFWVTGLLLLLANSPVRAAEKVTFMQDWLIGGKHVPFLTAEELGFYRKAGIEVTILRGFGSGAVSKVLAEGKATFGFVDAGSMVLARAPPICMHFILRKIFCY